MTGPHSRSVPSLPEQLKRVLVQERELGFTDRAAVGGLDKFLARWSKNAGSSSDAAVAMDLKLIQGSAQSYRAMAPHERATWVGRLLGETATKPAKASAARSAVKPVGPPRLLGPGQTLDTALAEVKGFSEELVEKLGKLRRPVATLRELLYNFPARHIDFSDTRPISDLRTGEEQTVVGVVWESGTAQQGPNPRARYAEVILGDDTGNVRAVWFGQPWMAGTLKQGARIALSGRVTEFRGKRTFENPEYDFVDKGESSHTGRLVPVYPLTAGLYPRTMRNQIKRTLDLEADPVPEILPPEVRQRRNLIALPRALRQAHFPESPEAAAEARRRIAFDELLVLQIGVIGRRKQWRESMPGHPLRADRRVLEAFFGTLPFTLTGAQQRVIGEVLGDLEKSTAMSRLIQGEVGSGKTVVALAAALAAFTGGQQAAFMAPTELLAEQHFRTVRSLLSVFPRLGQTADFLSVRISDRHEPVNVALLMGSTSRKRKEELHRMTAQGAIDLLVGTHALFQKDVEFADLGLAIVDEQHRFGVMQRTELRQKGHNPHLLVMTATPIPRSLTLTLYGDLDLSTINELPPGRLPIKTKWLDAARRDTAYRFIEKEVAAGRQAFIVYPLVEESDKLEVAAATEEHLRLSHDVFPHLRLGLLHGRMKQKEKDRVMLAFRAGELAILVSTAVVEVGIDVPNATVMMIDWADRFGLAQLHQFRGRVGRGQHQSYCILVSHTPSSDGSERLAILERVQDGFALAEEDLRLRGAGEFFGTRQSGLPDLRMARLSDATLLEEARTEAAALFGKEPTTPELTALRAEVTRAWGKRAMVIGEA